MSVKSKEIINVIRHVRFEQHYGITFAYMIKHGDSRSVKCGWSVCNGDMFNRKIGMEKAMQRLMGDKQYDSFSFEFPENESLVNTTMQAIEQLPNTHQFDMLKKASQFIEMANSVL